MSNRVQIQLPGGWFAAGQPLLQALQRLSDGAFKLFVYLCLEADRSTGSLTYHQKDLARALRKSRRSIGSYLQELTERSVCWVERGANQHEAGKIQILDPFWPYARSKPSAVSQEESRYVQAVARFLAEAPGVSSAFSPADRKLAVRFYREGISLEEVERAILLGCARKHVAWLNGQDGSSITSLRYFEPILAELSQQPVSAQYWVHLRKRLARLEQQWKDKRACENFTQASRSEKETR